MLTNDRPLEDIPRLEAALERLDNTAFLGSPCQALLILLPDPDVAQLMSPRAAHELIEDMRRTATNDLAVLREARATDYGAVPPPPFCVRETRRPTSQQETAAMTDTLEAFAADIEEKARIVNRIKTLDDIIERCLDSDVVHDRVGTLSDLLADDDINELLQAAPPSMTVVEGILDKIRVEARREMTELRAQIGLPPKVVPFPADAGDDDGDAAST